MRISRSQVGSWSCWWCHDNTCSPQAIGCGTPGQIWKLWSTLVWVQQSHSFFSLPDDLFPIGEDHHLWWWCSASQVFFCLSIPVFDGWLQDYILNYMGVEAMVDALDTKFSSLYKEQAFSTFMVRGQSAGLYKNAGTLSYVRIFGAGHEVPAYKVCIGIFGFLSLAYRGCLLSRVRLVLEKLQHRCLVKLWGTNPSPRRDEYDFVSLDSLILDLADK